MVSNPARSPVWPPFDPPYVEALSLGQVVETALATQDWGKANEVQTAVDEHMQQFSRANLACMSLLLEYSRVLPPSNAIVERFFSVLRIIRGLCCQNAHIDLYEYVIGTRCTYSHEEAKAKGISGRLIGQT